MPNAEAMSLSEFVKFVRAARMGVVATTTAEGHPQAALVALAVTRAGEVVFDTKVSARKVANIEGNPRVALVIGCDDGVSVQVEGDASVLSDAERDRYGRLYLEQFPGSCVLHDEFAVVRVIPRWIRLYDARPESFRVVEGPRT